MDVSFIHWGFFLFVILSLLFLDLGFFHKKSSVISFKESLLMSFFYIIIALIFGLWILYIKGLDAFAQYITGFLLEKSLALDNIFLISMIFSSLAVPLKYQHRVLFWGVLGVIFLRAIMISLGLVIITKFEWVLYLFAIFMIVTGFKMLFVSHQPTTIHDNKLFIWMQKHLPLTDRFYDQNFWIYQKAEGSATKKLVFTPLFVALVLIETIDLIFAVDSIPAIFSITQDPYIIYTSNIFAVLGLRALYFALASMVRSFYYLKYALATLLIFIGSKMFIADALGLAKIPPLVSLITTCSILFIGIVASLGLQKK